MMTMLVMMTMMIMLVVALPHPRSTRYKGLNLYLSPPALRSPPPSTLTHRSLHSLHPLLLNLDPNQTSGKTSWKRLVTILRVLHKNHLYCCPFRFIIANIPYSNASLLNILPFIYSMLPISLYGYSYYNSYILINDEHPGVRINLWGVFMSNLLLYSSMNLLQW